jgi:hypothetical protein
MSGQSEREKSDKGCFAEPQEIKIPASFGKYMQAKQA